MNEILELQWTEHSKVFSNAVLNLRSKTLFSDATLACEGKFFPVHKFVLSTCSNYFSAIFDVTPCSHPVIIINNISCRDLESLLNFMYCGETSVREQHIQDVMRAAGSLHIKGLTVHQELPFGKTKNSDHLGTNTLITPKKSHCPLSQNNVPEFPGMPKMPYAHAIQSFAQAPRAVSSPARHNLPPIGSFDSDPITIGSNGGPINSKQQPVIPQQNSMQTKNCQGIKAEKIQMTGSFHNQLADFTQGSYDPVRKSPASTDSNSSSVNCVTPIQSKPLKEIISYTAFQSLGTNTSPKADVQMDEKLINEDFNLDRSVKDLEIDTENGKVTIPDILEGFVDMKNLYEEKESCDDSEDLESKISHVSNASEDTQKAVSPLAGMVSFQEETNDALYDFREDLPDASNGISKESGTRSSSRINNNVKRGPETASQEEAPAKRMHSSLVGRTRSTRSPVPSTSRNSPSEGQFGCTKCDRICKKRDSLTRHMRTHDEYPYACTICGFKNKIYRDHTNHLKTHAHVKCDKCSYTTFRQVNLRRHLKSHDEKVHRCTFEQCRQAFRRPQQLKVHIVTHMKKDKNGSQ